MTRALILDDGNRFALLHPGRPDADTAVVIIVGGPQYRVGSHRHFVQLGRALDEAGWPCLRFDHAGIGDQPGPLPRFEALDDEIAAAIALLQRERPDIRRVVLWGLCDAASAALLYVARRDDPLVQGLVLLNPWVRSAQGEAQVRMQHYYAGRLRNPAFWRKLLSGKVALGAARELLANWRHARTAPASVPARSYQIVMAEGWTRFAGPLLLQLSGRDHTAREFEAAAHVFPQWQHALQREGLQRIDYPEADHTLSRIALMQQSIDDLLVWMNHHFALSAR